MNKRVDLFYEIPFFAKWNRRHSVKVCFQEQHAPQVILFQAVRLIHEWMEEKLQTYFSGDTECLNHNTWMISCKLTFLFSAAIPHKMVVLIKVYQFQLPDHDELLKKRPRCETNTHWFRNQLKEMETRWYLWWTRHLWLSFSCKGEWKLNCVLSLNWQ